MRRTAINVQENIDLERAISVWKDCDLLRSEAISDLHHLLDITEDHAIELLDRRFNPQDMRDCLGIEVYGMEAEASDSPPAIEPAIEIAIDDVIIAESRERFLPMFCWAAVAMLAACVLCATLFP